jgi:hypothetical protein
VESDGSFVQGAGDSLSSTSIPSEDKIEPWYSRALHAVRVAYDEAVAEGAFTPHPPLPCPPAEEDLHPSDMHSKPLSVKSLMFFWIGAYLVGVFGLLSWRTFVLLSSLYCYSAYTHRLRVRNGITKHLQAASEVLSMSEEPDRDFRVYEAAWLNKVMHEFWPNSLSPWLTQTLRSVLQRLINEGLGSSQADAELSRGKARGLSASFESFSLGEASPEIISVQEHLESNRLILDLDFSYECSGSIRLVFIGKYFGRERISMALSEVRMRGVVRLIFTAFLPGPPYFAQIGVSFVGRPDLNFKFSVAGVGYGIGAMVKRILRSSVLDTMVYPEYIPVQLYEDEELDNAEPDLAERLLMRPAPTGLLVVTLKRCEHLQGKDF